MSTQPLRCAGALIVDRDGRIFFQRRSPHRRLFPDWWDIVGGLIRRITEEGFALLRSIGR
ncbi:MULTISPECIES: NUDIX domain-containing protein [unclassified Micromonospora]|uniref:NUDIX domain-containing protein n=1 Tax=unclassified Micromonospora TaxID=2617518 RepID=UPI0033E43C9A